MKCFSIEIVAYSRIKTMKRTM